MYRFSSLRQLAKQYADGAMDQVSYRRARADYIDAVLKGEVTLGELSESDSCGSQAMNDETTDNVRPLAGQQRNNAAPHPPASTKRHQWRPWRSQRIHRAIIVGATVIAGIVAIGTAAVLLPTTDRNAIAKAVTDQPSESTQID